MEDYCADVESDDRARKGGEDGGDREMKIVTRCVSVDRTWKTRNWSDGEGEWNI